MGPLAARPFGPLEKAVTKAAYGPASRADVGRGRGMEKQALRGRLLAAAVMGGAIAAAAHGQTLVPTGMAITPDAAPGSRFETLNPGLAAFPDYVAGQASNVALSPDARTLLVVTSGF